jgi:hypothetical protein
MQAAALAPGCCATAALTAAAAAPAAAVVQLAHMLQAHTPRAVQSAWLLLLALACSLRCAASHGAGSGDEMQHVYTASLCCSVSRTVKDCKSCQCLSLTQVRALLDSATQPVQHAASRAALCATTALLAALLYVHDSPVSSSSGGAQLPGMSTTPDELLLLSMLSPRRLAAAVRAVGAPESVCTARRTRDALIALVRGPVVLGAGSGSTAG